MIFGPVKHEKFSRCLVSQYELYRDQVYRYTPNLGRSYNDIWIKLPTLWSQNSKMQSLQHHQGNLLRPWQQKLAVFVGQCSRVTLHYYPPHNLANLHTNGHRAAHKRHWCLVVCHHLGKHGRRGQRYKRLFWKQIFGLQPMSDLKAQFAVCEYLHYVSHIIWLIMNRNREACLAYVNNICLIMLVVGTAPGCVFLPDQCRLCAFFLNCVLV